MGYQVMRDLDPSGLSLLLASIVIVLVTLAVNLFGKRKVNFDQMEKFLVCLVICALAVLAVVQIYID